MFPSLTVITIFILFVLIATTTADDEVLSTVASNNGLCLKPECIQAAARILRDMNSKIKPCDDFYEFVCGNYPKPESEPVGNVPITSQLEVDSRLHRIIEDIDELNAPKIFADLKTSYDNCRKMNEWKDDSASRLEASQNINDTVAQWLKVSETQWNVTEISPEVVSSWLFEVNEGIDETNVSDSILELTIRDPPISWYHLKDGKSSEVVLTYYAYIADIANNLNLGEILEQSEFEDIALFDSELANIVVPATDNYDVNDRYVKTTVGHLDNVFPNLYLKKLSNRESDMKVQIKMDVDILESLEKWKLSKSKKALANWITWRWTLNRVNQLGPYFVHRTKMFFHALYGGTTREEKWRKCIGRVRQDFSLILDVLYYGQYLSDNIVKDSIKMFARVKQQFIGFIEKSKWLGANTKNHALKKIRTITHNLNSYEEFMLDKKSNESYSDLKLSDGLLSENRVNVTKILLHSIQSSSTKEENMRNYNFVETEALYFHQSRFLNLGAKHYTDEYYNIGRPRALNYGTFGFTLGHELAHSLDDTNRHLDKNGNLVVWWDSRSNATFVKHIQCLVKRYKKYGSDEFKLHLNSFVSRNDDIADLVGVKAAYFAYDKWAKEHKPEKQLPGLDYTPRQTFWIAYANSLCANYQKQAFRTTFKSSTHSPEKLRVNMPLSNIQEFANDFKCSPNSKMNPVKKCTVW